MTTAWDIVRKEHPHVWCLSCTTHCLHLLFKDIFELEWFKESHEPIHDAVKWIREHPWCKARVERYNKARRNKHRKRRLKLKLPGVTQYGSKYFTLKRAIQMRKDVRRIFNHPNFGPLFPDPYAEGKRYYKKTGMYPINHGMVIKRELAEEHPWVVLNVYKAFEDAAAYCDEQRKAMMVNHIETGLLPPEAEVTIATPLIKHGVVANRKELEAISLYSFEQGLTPRRLTLEEIFAVSTLDK